MNNNFHKYKKYCVDLKREDGHNKTLKEFSSRTINNCIEFWANQGYSVVKYWEE